MEFLPQKIKSCLKPKFTTHPKLALSRACRCAKSSPDSGIWLFYMQVHLFPMRLGNCSVHWTTVFSAMLLGICSFSECMCFCRAFLELYFLCLYARLQRLLGMTILVQVHGYKFHYIALASCFSFIKKFEAAHNGTPRALPSKPQPQPNLFSTTVAS